MGASSSPNIVNVSSIFGVTVGFALGATATTDLMTVAANKVLRITAIRATNVDTSNDVTVTVSIVPADDDPDGIADLASLSPLRLALGITIPVGSALDLVEKGQIYMRAGDVLEGGADDTGNVELLVSYEVLDDA